MRGRRVAIMHTVSIHPELNQFLGWWDATIRQLDTALQQTDG